jgi:hypothetical protein
MVPKEIGSGEEKICRPFQLGSFPFAGVNLRTEHPGFTFDDDDSGYWGKGV